MCKCGSSICYFSRRNTTTIISPGSVSSRNCWRRPNFEELFTQSRKVSEGAKKTQLCVPLRLCVKRLAETHDAKYQNSPLHPGNHSGAGRKCKRAIARRHDRSRHRIVANDLQ